VQLKPSSTRDVREAGEPEHRTPAAPSSQATADEDEVRWVLRARKALARGEAQVALGLLRELDAKIPNGRLGEERAACRASARCLLQPTTGNAERESFIARYPKSIHFARVSRSCGTGVMQVGEVTKP
jgi:hypothetical protein